MSTLVRRVGGVLAGICGGGVALYAAGSGYQWSTLSFCFGQRQGGPLGGDRRKFGRNKRVVPKDAEKLDKRTFVVTGADKGIGKELALHLAKRKARVVMACR